LVGLDYGENCFKLVGFREQKNMFSKLANLAQILTYCKQIMVHQHSCEIREKLVVSLEQNILFLFPKMYQLNAILAIVRIIH
jgi:hypothetical protein